MNTKKILRRWLLLRATQHPFECRLQTSADQETVSMFMNLNHALLLAGFRPIFQLLTQLYSKLELRNK